MGLLDRRQELTLGAHGKPIFLLVDLRRCLLLLRLFLGCLVLGLCRILLFVVFNLLGWWRGSLLTLLFLVLLLPLLFRFLLGGLWCRLFDGRRRSVCLHGQLLVELLALQVEFGLGIVHIQH